MFTVEMIEIRLILLTEANREIDASNTELMNFIEKNIRLINNFFLIKFTVFTKRSISSPDVRGWLKRNHIDGFPSMVYLHNNRVVSVVSSVRGIRSVLGTTQQEYIDSVVTKQGRMATNSNISERASNMDDVEGFLDDYLEEKIVDEEDGSDDDDERDPIKLHSKMMELAKTPTTQKLDPEYVRLRDAYRARKQLTDKKKSKSRKAMHNADPKAGRGRDGREGAGFGRSRADEPVHKMMDHESVERETGMTETSVREEDMNTGRSHSDILSQVMSDEITVTRKTGGKARKVDRYDDAMGYNPLAHM